MSAMKDPKIAEAVDLINEACEELDKKDSADRPLAATLVRKAWKALEGVGQTYLLDLKMGDRGIVDTLKRIEKGCLGYGFTSPDNDVAVCKQPSYYSDLLGQIVDQLREIDDPPQQKPKRERPGEKQ